MALRPWWTPVLPLSFDDGSGPVSDLDTLHRHLGLPSCSAWIEKWNQGNTEPRVAWMGRDAIANNAGYPVVIDPREDIAIDAGAAIEAIESRDAFDCVLSDLEAVGMDAASLRRLSSLWTMRMRTPGCLFLAARASHSPVVVSVLVVVHEISVDAEAVRYRLRPYALVNQGDTTTRAALTAALHLQIAADMEAVMIGMARARTVLPLSPICYSQASEHDGLARGFCDLIDSAHDQAIGDLLEEGFDDVVPTAIAYDYAVVCEI